MKWLKEQYEKFIKWYKYTKKLKDTDLDKLKDTIRYWESVGWKVKIASKGRKWPGIFVVVMEKEILNYKKEYLL